MSRRSSYRLRPLPGALIACLVLCACGGQPSSLSPAIGQGNPTVAGGAGPNPGNPLAGLPALKEVAAKLPHAMFHRNRHGAEYEPLLSSPPARLTVNADLSLTLSAGAGQLSYAAYAVGNLHSSDAPETLTVVGAEDSAFWIAVSNYDSNSWEWHRPAPLNGIQTVDLSDGKYLSNRGVLCYALAVHNGAAATVRECLLATSAEQGTPVPGAEYTTYGALLAELRVRSVGPPTGAGLWSRGVQSGYQLAESLTGTAVEYSVTLPDHASLLGARLAATPQGSPSLLLRVRDSDPLEVAVIPQSEDDAGSVYAEIDESGDYILFWLEGHSTSSAKGTASLAVLGNFDFARDSWPIDSSVDPPYSGFAVGNGGGMSRGACWFSSVGRFDSGLGSAGLYEHFAGDVAWAQGVAAHLQAQMAPSWLSYQEYNGLSGRARVDKLNLARDIGLAGDGGLPLYSLSGYPLTGAAGAYPVLAPLAAGYSLLYAGEQYGLAYFYDPAAGYNDTTNPFLAAVNASQLADRGFTAPFASLTGRWSLEGVQDSDGWIRDSFDPANKSKFTSYENPELVIGRSGAPPAAQVRLTSVGEPITLAAGSAFWDSFPAYSTLTMEWLDSGGSEMYYTGVPRTGINSTSEFELSFASLLGLAQSGPGTIKSGTCVVPYYLKLETAPDGEGHRHHATCRAKPDGLALYYAGPDWEVLLPPQEVSATDEDTAHVTVSWSAPAQGPPPTGYRVYRTASLDEPWTGPLNSTPTSLEYYYDNPPELGTDYWYAVSSYSSAGPEPLESAVSYADGGQQPPIEGPPVIYSVSPLYSHPGAGDAFHAEVTGSLPLSYAWDFGGGATPNTSTDEMPYAFLGPVGTYQASLTVTNAEGSDYFAFALESVPIPQVLVTIPPVLGMDADFLHIFYGDPLVRRDDRLIIDPFNGITPSDSEGYNDVLKTSGDEFLTAVAGSGVYPVVVVIEGGEPSDIQGPDDSSIDGVFVVETRPGMLVLDVSVLTASSAYGGGDYAYRVFSQNGASLGIGTFFVDWGKPTVTTPPVGIEWAINAWDREPTDIGDQEYTDFSLDLSTLGTATPDVLWIAFDGGWVYDWHDIGPYSNTVLLIDHPTYGQLAKDIRLVTRAYDHGGYYYYLGICTFTEEDIYNAGAPEDPGNLQAGESYTLSLEDPNTAGIDYEYTVSLEVTGA